MKKKAIIVSGYFNPIHKGHLEYFNNAKELADELFVIVNSDLQRGAQRFKRISKRSRTFIYCSEYQSSRQSDHFCG